MNFIIELSLLFKKMIITAIVTTLLIAATTGEDTPRTKCSVSWNKVRSDLFEAIPVAICKEPGYNGRATSGGTNSTLVCTFSKTVDDILKSLSKKSKTSLIPTIQSCSTFLEFCSGQNPQHIGTCTGRIATSVDKNFSKDLNKNCAEVNKALKSISGSNGASKLQNWISKNGKSCKADSTGYSCKKFHPQCQT